MPAYLPYAVGLEFARKKQDWVIAHRAERTPAPLVSGACIGKSYRLVITDASADARLSTAVKGQEIQISIPAGTPAAEARAATERACERALKTEAEELLGRRLDYLAQKHNYTYKDVRVRKLRARWGSCNSQNLITLSIYLVQLPWHLIDYVLLHELVHTRHMHHQASFWNELTAALPDVNRLRKEIRAYNPSLLPA
jgi:hypothetical protein